LQRSGANTPYQAPARLFDESSMPQKERTKTVRIMGELAV
jgi:hypothetical protein